MFSWDIKREYSIIFQYCWLLFHCHVLHRCIQCFMILWHIYIYLLHACVYFRFCSKRRISYSDVTSKILTRHETHVYFPSKTSSFLLNKIHVSFYLQFPCIQSLREYAKEYDSLLPIDLPTLRNTVNSNLLYVISAFESSL